MFCPKCGKADQKPDSYCRQCGSFLFDYDKPSKRKQTPEEHLKVNAVLSLMTAIVSITLSIMLYSIFLGREDTPIIIYITAGFLIAIFAWQVQTFWRSLLLKKHFKKNNQSLETMHEAEAFKAPPTKQLLPEADLENYVAPSVGEGTTRKLKTEK